MSRAALTLARWRPSAGTGSRPTCCTWRGSTTWSSTRIAMRPCVSGPAAAGVGRGSLAPCPWRVTAVCHPAAEPPVARLLHHGLPRAFALPEDTGVPSDADESTVQLSELLPLPVLMKHSVTAPLAAQ